MPRSNSEASSGGSITSDEDGVKRRKAQHSLQPSTSTTAVPPASREDSYLSAQSHAPSTSSTTPLIPETPTERFKSSVTKVMHMRKSSGAMQALLGQPGAEPGVDPRRQSHIAEYSHLVEKCEIEVVDFSTEKVTFRQFENQGFTSFLTGPDAKTPHWAKVRWINVGGISWDVLSTLVLRYNLHPLSVEDILHARSTSRSKADYYAQHLFIHVLCHSLGEDDASPLHPTWMEPARSTSPEPLHGSDSEGEQGPSFLSRRSMKRRATRKKHFSHGDVEHLARTSRKQFMRWRDRASSLTWEGRNKAAKVAALEELKRGDRVNVLIRNMYIFLLPNGTVISIHQADRSFGDPILARLKQGDTVLRTSADPSLLVQALLDLVVDRAVQIVDKYQEKILDLERQILLKPTMDAVRNLHILSGDLTLHRRTLAPMKNLVHGLRRYDSDRCAAVAAYLPPDTPKVSQYMSHQARVYLADIFDHTEHVVTSLEMFANISDNLVDYCFNNLSYETNEVMRRMTLAMIIFLPLTLLTGYFGMNFDPMPSVNNNSDALFWKIAVPVMAVILPLFLWGDIKKMWHAAKKKMELRRLEQAHIAEITGKNTDHRVQ